VDLLIGFSVENEVGIGIGMDMDYFENCTDWRLPVLCLSWT
jgi:hypothetical protein